MSDRRLRPAAPARAIALWRREPRNYAWAALVVVLASGACWAGSSLLSLADKAMVFLLGVLLVSSRLPRRPSLFAAVLSVAALDFLFVPPPFTLAVEDLRYVLTFAVMLAVALLVSSSTVRLREQAEEARERERRTTELARERALLMEQATSARVAAETERTRSALLSAVSHDVRTPLASITGAASALAGDGLDDDARRELLDTIREESARLTRLIGDLLDLTRLESGDLVVKKEPYPLEEIVDSAVQRLSSGLAGRPIERVQPDEVLVAPVDPVLLEQVLVNLLENAAKYGPARSPIEIRLVAGEEQAVIEVADRGPGLPPGEERRVFERFYRARDSHRSSGTGLGLTISEAIVRAHGGRIEAANREGGGARFRVSLPLEAAAGGRAA